jgi:hypothetical protein
LFSLRLSIKSLKKGRQAGTCEKIDAARKEVHADEVICKGGGVFGCGCGDCGGSKGLIPPLAIDDEGPLERMVTLLSKKHDSHTTAASCVDL